MNEPFNNVCNLYQNLLQLVKVLAQFGDNTKESNGKILIKTLLWFGVELNKCKHFKNPD
jgi:hypothetical protein